MAGIIVEIGSGDGKFALAIAHENPDKLVFAVEPNHTAAIKTSLKAAKSKAKGGTKNAIFVLGSLEELPDELKGKVNQVFINFPWAGLLDGLISGDEVAWGNIAEIMQPGADIDLLFSLSERDNLATNITSVKTILNRLKLFKLLECSPVNPGALKHYPSTWGKKLRFSPNRDFYYARLKRI